ncbi:MAG: bifunctional class I SAM-dependent methyltransferase/glycosyltransferase family 2 protein [Byssovorax sp.]
MMSQPTMGKTGAPAPAQFSEFERRELDRRRARVAIYDAIAEGRARWVAENHYYAEQVYRLIGSMVLPGSRVLEVGCGLGDLLSALPGIHGVGVDVSARMIELAKERHPGLDLRVCDVERDPLPEGPFDDIVLSDVVGHLDDIERALERLRPLLAPGGRVIVTYYNFVWEPVLKLAERLGRKTPWPDQNWLSMDDIGNLLYLAGYQVVRRGTDILLPAHVPVVSELANRVAAKVPVLKESALVDYFVARAAPEPLVDPLPSVSIICPCRNEKGNIREAVARTPVMGPKTELIFVDGNSNDGTVEEIQAVIAEYKGPLELRLVHQGNGKGKGDAVRKGFDAARYDVLMILDSDLTVPPEDLPKFYKALVTQKGEMINGVRLVYPMEGQAMRFLNLLGNKFFSLALSWLLEQPIKDSLCGTKVLTKKDYQRIADNRAFFGDFDPFGDFDLLFGAARLNMKIVDLPVRYRARTYGDTKISRFSHGFLLLKMTAFGFKKLRMGL